ncbi:MAG: ECF transporter S component [Oscillospiraceae bacterium]
MPLRIKRLKPLGFVLAAGLFVYVQLNWKQMNFTVVGCVFALLIVGMFFLGLEKRKPDAKDIMPIAVMCAAATVGRAVFGFIPQVKPVTVIVITMGVCFGMHTGFITGALCALVSNMLFGQGPWTLWQMLGWGIIGLLAGLLKDKKLSHSLIFMCGFSFVGAFVFGLITDVWTVVFYSADGITWGIVKMVYAGSLLFNLFHGLGNIAFCLLLYKPLRRILDRIRVKYGVAMRSANGVKAS